MRLEKIQHMLAIAPRVSQWWVVNKKGFENTEKIWEKRKTLWGDFNLVLIVLLGVCMIASLFAPGFWCLVSLCGTLALGLVGPLGLGFVAKRIELRRRLFNTQCYTQGIDQLYFDPDLASQEFSLNQRAELIGQLNGLGLDGEQIVALRNLDLPNSWWHTINTEVANCTQIIPSQKLTLEEVYIQVQSTIASEKHSKVLRL